MSRFYKNLSKLSQDRMAELALLCGIMMCLTVAAVFVSTGGMREVTYVLAKYHILSVSQTACVFPCNNTSFTEESLTPTVGGVQVSTVAPNTPVDWVWTAGSYGARNYSPVCLGSVSGSGVMCTIQQNSPNTNFGTCTPAYCNPNPCPPADQQYSCDKLGENCTTSCLIDPGQTCYPTTGCGTVDIYYGYACYGLGGITVSSIGNGCYDQDIYGGAAGYTGNYPASLQRMTAPSTPGTYTYYFCSNWLLHDGANALSCLPANLTVSNPAPTCSIPSASATFPGSTSQTWTATNASSASYTLDGVAQGGPTNPLVLNGLAVGSHTVVLTVSGPGGSANCGTAGNVVISAQPATSCTLSPATQTIATSQSATFTYTNPNANTTTYKVDGGAPITPSGGAFSVSGLALGTHSVIMTVTNATNSSTCGSATDVTVTATPKPVVNVSASPLTVNANGTSTLTWSQSGATGGQCTITAPSTGGTPTSFAALTSNTWSTNGFADYITANGYVYSIGGYNPTDGWNTKIYKARIESDLTQSSSWTLSGGTMSLQGLSISPPLLINGTVYQFGGYNNAAAAYEPYICSVPATSIDTSASWTCTTGVGALPSTGGYEYSNPIIVGDNIYKIGGANASGPVNGVMYASVASPTVWTYVSGVLPVSIYAGATAVIGNYVYYFGGYTTTSVATVYRALTSSNLTLPASWSVAGAIPAAMYNTSVAVDGSNVYLIGGYNTTNSFATIYQLPLSTLATGGFAGGSWTAAGSIPLAGGLDYPEDLIVNNKLYLMGGYNSNSASYVNKVYSAPFNDGLAYTTTAMNPWFTDGSTNQAATWPITANSTTYTLQCTNPGGTNSTNVVITEPDLCTNDPPFSGIQNPLPANTHVVSGTTCACNAGYLWNGSGCALPVPIINTPTITPLISGSITAVKRVKKGNQVSIDWNVTGLTPGDINTTCTVSSNPPGALTTQTWDKSGATWTQPATAPTATITGTTVFTVACANPGWAPSTISVSATVGLVPTFNEQ